MYFTFNEQKKHFFSYDEINNDGYMYVCKYVICIVKMGYKTKQTHKRSNILRILLKNRILTIKYD